MAGQVEREDWPRSPASVIMDTHVLILDPGPPICLLREWIFANVSAWQEQSGMKGVPNSPSCPHPGPFEHQGLHRYLLHGLLERLVDVLLLPLVPWESL